MAKIDSSVPKKVEKAAMASQFGTLIWSQVGSTLQPRHYIFNEGVVRTRLLSLSAWAWRDVERLWYDQHFTSHLSDDGGVRHQFIYTITLELRDGRSLVLPLRGPSDTTLARDFRLYGIRPDPQTNAAPSTAEKIQRGIATTQIANVYIQILTGDEISFGRVSAHKDGLLRNGKLYPWPIVGRPIYHHSLDVREPHKQQGIVQIPIRSKPDAKVNQEVLRLPAAEVFNLQTLALLQSRMDPSM